MEQLTDMGFNRELAARALAATGGKSTFKATEWILNQRKNEENQNSVIPSAAVARPQQARVDHFFSASSSQVHEAMIHTEFDDGEDVPSQRKGGITFRKVNSSKDKEDELAFAPRADITITDKSLDNPEASVAKLPSSRPMQSVPEPPPKKQKQEEQPSSRPIQSVPEPPPKKQKQEEQPPQAKSFPVLSLKPKNAKTMTPMAERMRPATVDDILGQDHLLGAKGILRSLLENDCLASVIFWGPPGTGKTSLARAIASAVSYRFVALSAVTSGVKEVRDVLEEAKKMKKYGQRTLLFLDEVHRFNKAQQDAFLPYVEAGHVVFIGATTENPSFEINAALLSRCKVLTLNKLQPEHLRKLIERAILDKEKGAVFSAGITSPELLRVEDDAIHFLAGAADGDARVALNTLEISVLAAVSRSQKCAPGGEGDGMAADPSGLRREASGAEKMVSNVKRESLNILEVLKENVQHSQEEYTRPFKKFVGGKNVTPQAATAMATAFEAEKETAAGNKDRELNAYSAERRGSGREDIAGTSEGDVDKSLVVVTLADVREALQRSHVFYDKTGEEHYNIISALHKSMRGGDADAAIYWLARMLEGGEGPLYVARRLVRFASEDVGLADPQALQQAVACYQACHFLGMPECNVHLAQCVTYLALAPKSVAVYQAIEAAQRHVRERGQNEPVPLHLRNAPTNLMKELGYGKGYIYPPSRNGPVEQEYMPPSLRGRKFLQWPESMLEEDA